MSADPVHAAMLALAHDLVEEIASGRALELAQGFGPPAPAPGAVQPGQPARKGASAVHPGLGDSLVTLPGDTISGHAYAHWQSAQPPAQPGSAPIAGQ